MRPNVELDGWNPATTRTCINKENARRWNIFHTETLVLNLLSNYLGKSSDSSLEEKEEQKEEEI